MTDNYEEYSRDDLLRLLRERDRKPRFGLVWERDEIDHDNSVNNDFIALDYDPELSHGDGPHENLLIEADNFDALRYLRMTHAGKVKCIYIDPPYNTGNKDFIYNDHFVDPDDVYKHSKWLEFMYRRLILARDLMSKDGVLLVSIGDENRSKLELLLDQVFPEMRAGSMVWRSRIGDNRPKGAYLSVNHEHVLVYAMPSFRFKGSEKTFSMYSNKDNDPRGEWRKSDLTGPAGYKNRPNTYYPIHNPDTDTWYVCNPDRVWVYASEKRVEDASKLRKSTMEQFIREKRIIFPENQKTKIWNSLDELHKSIESGDVPKDGNNNPMLRKGLPDLEKLVGKKIGWGIPAYKRYKSEISETEQPLSSWLRPASEKDYEELEGVKEVSSAFTDEGSKTLRQVLGSKSFEYPKPPSLLKALVEQSTQENDYVLDFFAGSGTTAHALLELNQSDNLKRKFILVSSTEETDDEPNKNVCRDVCAKRLKNVIDGYGKNKPVAGEFAYLRAKRIPVEVVFNEIQHDQIWIALQLIHESGFQQYNQETPIQMRENDNSFIAYIPKLTDETLKDIHVAIKGKSNITLYSWQPALLKQRIESSSVSFEPIPQFLTDRFGVGG
jgi:adenine-specific DNA-methyltransferase